MTTVWIGLFCYVVYLCREPVPNPAPTLLLCKRLQFELNCLLKSTGVMLSTQGVFKPFIKVIHLRSPCRKFEFPSLRILPQSISVCIWRPWHNHRDLPWGLGLVSLPQGLEMVTVFWQSALWRARFRFPVLVFKAVFRSHSPQAWNWYLHSAKGRVGPQRHLWAPRGVPWK